MTADCPDCHTDMFTSEPHPNYDHVHRVADGQLPRARNGGYRKVVRGYATGMGGLLPQIWVFFDRIEPAYAFARAGRMSALGDVVSCGVFEAACESRWREFPGEVPSMRETRTLHIDFSTSVLERVRGSDDRDLLARWTDGTVPGKAYFRLSAGYS